MKRKKRKAPKKPKEPQKIAYIWQTSIYNGGFRCKCGTRLFDAEEMKPVMKVLRHTADGKMYCRKCGTYAGRYQNYYGPDTGLAGAWKGG